MMGPLLATCVCVLWYVGIGSKVVAAGRKTPRSESQCCFAPPVVSHRLRGLVHRAPGAVMQSAPTAPRRGELYALFTGIVEDKGTILDANHNAKLRLWDGREVDDGLRLRIHSPIALDGCYTGCSIAVDGVCLTVTRFDGGGDDAGGKLPANSFEVEIAPETVRRTHLGSRRKGDLINIERAAKMNSEARNSGHYVQGHVDHKGEIIEKWWDGEAVGIKIKYPASDVQTWAEEILPISVVTEKGFIAVDGISLTVTGVNHDEGWFTVMLIPHTQQAVVLPHKEVGAYVNVETDILAKQVAAQMHLYLKRQRLDADERLSAVEAGVRYLKGALEALKR